jgi:hypothetical protein
LDIVFWGENGIFCGIDGKLKAFFDDKNLTELKTQRKNEQAQLCMDIEFRFTGLI